ncbi:MAG TPA: hypothetical protein VD903_07010 [Pseudonocardia sp.]|nr:hypothetical protein [Pseudonocardia sp.]
MTVRGTPVARAVLAGAVVCAIAAAVTAPALAGPADDAADEPVGACRDAGPLGRLFDDGPCRAAPDAERSLFPAAPAPHFDPDDLFDPDFPGLPDGDGTDDTDEESDAESDDAESDDAESGDAGSDDDSGDEGTSEEPTEDSTDESGSDDSGDGSDGDADARDPDPTGTAVEAAGSRTSAGGDAPAQKREAARDAGAGAAVARAVLPGVGDAVDGSSSGLDWTGALAGPPGPPDPPAGPPPSPPAQAAPVDPPPPTAPQAAPTPVGYLAADDVGTAAFVDALPSPPDLRWDAGAILPSLALTLLLLAGLAFPAGVLNKAAAEHADRVHALLARLRVPPAAGRNAAGTFAVTTGVTGVAGAVMCGFLVPTFPFDGSAPAILIGLAAGFVVVTAALQGSQLLYVSRWWGVRCHLTPFPGFLLLAAVGVVLSLAVGLAPGLVLGTLVAFDTARRLRTDEEGPAVALAAGAVTAAGGLAWVLRDPLVAAAGAPGAFLPAALGTALTTVTAAAAANLAFALVPLSFLPGAALLRWSPALWAVFACIGAFAFVHLAARPVEGALAGRAGLIAVLLGAYLVGAAALWAWLRYGFGWTTAARLNPAPRR